MENIIQIEGIVKNLSIKSADLGLYAIEYRQIYVESHKFTCTVNGYLLQGNFQELFFEEGSNVRIVTYMFDDDAQRHHIDAILNLDTGILHMPPWLGYGIKLLFLDLVFLFPILMWLSVFIFVFLLWGATLDVIPAVTFFSNCLLVFYGFFLLISIPWFWIYGKTDQELLADLGFSNNTLSLRRFLYFRNWKFGFGCAYAEVYRNGKYCHGIHDCKKLVDVYPDFKLSDVYIPKGNFIQ